MPPPSPLDDLPPEMLGVLEMLRAARPDAFPVPRKPEPSPGGPEEPPPCP